MSNETMPETKAVVTANPTPRTFNGITTKEQAAELIKAVETVIAVPDGVTIKRVSLFAMTDGRFRVSLGE